ncbi:septal ring lytic transglycosylase RlpA family protein [Acidobacteriota bacterium]
MMSKQTYKKHMAIFLGCGFIIGILLSGLVFLSCGTNQMEGEASYYADSLHGNKTASGELYDMNAFTAAHRELPFGTKVKVTNKSNGKFVTVKINDRGPYAKHRIIDLSRAAAERIDLVRTGHAEVTLQIVN